MTRLAVNAVLLGLVAGAACFAALWLVLDVGVRMAGR